MKCLALIGLALTFSACAHVPTSPDAPAKPATGADPLFRRAWRVTKAPAPPAPGSIYIFLPNGTLLETSCGEPYRVALWTRDAKDPHTLYVVENQLPAFTATIPELNDTTLRLQQKLPRSNETRDLTLSGVDQEFVCPDLPK
jgi:hypothetical protein